MTKNSQWFIRSDSYPNSQMRLILFAPAGAGTAFFKTWQSKLPPSIEVCPVLLPGRERRLKEEVIQQMPIILDELLNEFHGLLDKPFACFGHSFGALLAFEFARLLSEEILPLPKALYVSGCRAAHLPIRRDNLHQLADADFIAAIAEMGGIPTEILQSHEFLKYLLPVLRADMSIFERYVFRSGAKLNLPIFALAGHDDDWVTGNELAGWGQQTTQHFEQRNFVGGHFYLQSAETELIAYIVTTLAALSKSALPNED